MTYPVEICAQRTRQLKLYTLGYDVPRAGRDSPGLLRRGTRCTRPDETLPVRIPSSLLRQWLQETLGILYHVHGLPVGPRCVSTRRVIAGETARVAA